MNALAAIPITPLASSNSWLITPNVGLTIWTLLVFAISLYILNKVAFPRIRDALDALDAEFAKTVPNVTVTGATGASGNEARTQSEEIIQRARQTAESHEHEARDRGKEMLAEAAKRAEREIDAATKRALDDIRREVADLTVMATEKVTRKTLDDADQRRLVEEALAELDFSGLSSSGASNN